MTGEVKSVVDLIETISRSCYYDEDYRDYSNFKELKDITKDIWEKHHAELIYQLSKPNESEPDVDFQVFWYECLGFPPEIPLYRDLQGKTWGCYGDGHLPSAFNHYGSHHDAVITFAGCNNNNAFINLDSTGNCMNISENEWDVRLDFLDIVDIYIVDSIKESQSLSVYELVENLKGASVIAIYEVPPIKYILNSLGISNDSKIASSRLFKFDLSGYTDLVICCNEWQIHIKE